MHIEADLDATHAQRLIELQQKQNKSISEIIADLIDSTWNQAPESRMESDKSPLYQAFEKAGLIGCIATGEELSSTYKEKMNFSNKVGGTNK